MAGVPVVLTPRGIKQGCFRDEAHIIDGAAQGSLESLLNVDESSLRTSLAAL